jgi:hypothetical protein
VGILVHPVAASRGDDQDCKNDYQWYPTVHVLCTFLNNVFQMSGKSLQQNLGDPGGEISPD